MLQVGLPQAKFVVVKCSVERRVELAAAAECKVERFEDVFVKARLAEAPRLVGVWALVKQTMNLRTSRKYPTLFVLTKETITYSFC